MLIEVNPNKLGDKLLSKEERLLKSFEETDKELQKYRLPGQDELKKAEQRLGVPMAYSDLVRRVTKLNPAIFVEDSRNMPGFANFYTVVDGQKKCLNAAFEKAILPEFSIVITDAADLPIKEKRGWRTVLYRLLASGGLTWRQILTVFGDAHGLNSDRWRQLTRRYRT